MPPSTPDRSSCSLSRDDPGSGEMNLHPATLSVCRARASSTSSFPLSRQRSNGQSLNPLRVRARVSRDRKTSKDNWSSPVFAVRAPTKAFLVSRGRFPRGEKTPREENDDRGRNLLISSVFSSRASRREYVGAAAASDKCGYPIWFYRLISFALDNHIPVWRAPLFVSQIAEGVRVDFIRVNLRALMSVMINLSYELIEFN